MTRSASKRTKKQNEKRNSELLEFVQDFLPIRSIHHGIIETTDKRYIDLTNKYIVLDLSELKGKLLPVGMFIALDYVWDTVKADRTKKKAIMIDEIWQLIGANSNRMAAEFCLTILK